jgi:biopolymer transport protein ExbD
MEKEGPAVGAAPAGPPDEAEPVRFVTKRESDEGIDMTPMVDVTFLLLIFFMVTAAYALQKSIKVPPPDRQESAAQARYEDYIENDDYVVIRIARDNTVWVNEQEAPTEQEVLVKLREAREGSGGSGGRGPSSLLVVADSEALHETVVMCLDAGNAVGMENIRVACMDEEEL